MDEYLGMLMTEQLDHLAWKEIVAFGVELSQSRDVEEWREDEENCNFAYFHYYFSFKPKSE